MRRIFRTSFLKQSRFRMGRIVFCLVIVGMLLACSFSKNDTQRVVLACPSQWTSTSLFGQEKQVSGFLADLMQKIGEKENLDIQLLFLPEKEAQELLDKKECDGFFSALPKTFSTEKQYAFSQPLFSSGFLLIVRKEMSQKSLLEFVSVNVGITRADFSQVIAHIPLGWQPYMYTTMYAALDDVLNHRIDGALIDSLNFNVVLSRIYLDAFKPIFPSIAPREICLLVPQSDQGLLVLEKIQRGKEKLQAENGIADLLSYWNLISLTEGMEKNIEIPKK